MRTYETAFILRPALEEEALTTTVGRVIELIASGGGSIEHRDDWGKRRLAYEIGGERDGYYTILRFKADSPTLKGLERAFRLNEDVLRYLIIRWEAPARRQREPDVAAPASSAPSSGQPTTSLGPIGPAGKPSAGPPVTPEAESPEV
ncbi:MAG TPA: 30S ribosomal protein S6 [Clostridiales bacterium]|nr:30S ribosomal protein S6 [Clostridiales bacterium]